ncbi:MAG: MFS transporter [Clostridia bacterium]|nr:MFS transporter [Clostridia bacterium]
MDKRYNKTIYASFVGYVVQAIINNFTPLLFLTFQDTYGISFNKISLLITINFCIQLFIDLISAKFIDKIGYRASIIIAHATGAAGLIGLAFLPDIMPDPFIGLVMCIAVYAIGGGIIEVLISPIVESCPTENKEGAMSLLHSFYCWGHVAVVIVSTLFFTFAGIGKWRILACLWAIVPVINGIVFTKVPLASMNIDGERGMSVRELLKSKLFWVMFVMMICSGASEQGISQWASAFAEKALNVSKTAGDLAGPLSFAVLMGLSRAVYAKFSEKIKVERFMLISSALCVISYLLASLSGSNVISFIGCALCGLSVGIMWPGTFSLGASEIKRGGTAMFAFFALAGDVGCSAGPTLVGFISDMSGNMKTGILAGTVFPLVMITAICVKKKIRKRHP